MSYGNTTHRKPICGQQVCLIGIALKYHAISSCGVGSSTMKTKVAKFLYPISSQLELEKINITAIQLIISNKYTTQVSIEFRDN
eukprot:jgi/Galph1/15/GphlegSOOS_G67.1